ncbi:hypothetical protein Scep_012668 [Stephania cephalantha]|uniref:Uncharacterized protein n=1 Tax=Stephania cephalantha TaxID=152367 RepID=A0AAP0JHJ8_9MAGN
MQRRREMQQGGGATVVRKRRRKWRWRDGGTAATPEAAVARRWCRQRRRRGFDVGAVNDAMAVLDRSLLDEGCESTNVDDAMETKEAKINETPTV